MQTLGVYPLGVVGRGSTAVDNHGQLLGEEVHAVLGAHRTPAVVGVFVAGIGTGSRHGEAVVEFHAHTGLDTHVTLVHARESVVYIGAELVVVVTRALHSVAELGEECRYTTFYHRRIQLIGEVAREYLLRLQTPYLRILHTGSHIGIAGQRGTRLGQSVERQAVVTVDLIHDTGLDTGVYKIELFAETFRLGTDNLGTTVTHQTFALERGVGESGGIVDVEER